MDNASKALIMAGAILLAVAIVGLGVYLFSLSQGLIDTAEASLNGLSVDMQNNEILKYEGQHRGTQVRQLIDKVNYLEDKWPVDLTYDTSGGGHDGKANGKDGIKSGYLYDITIHTDSTTGYVDSVKIVRHTTD